MSAGSGRVLGAVFGAFMLPAGAALLIWNEVHMRDVGSALQEGAGTVREAPADQVDPALQGRLVHVAGPIRVPAPLADPELPAVKAPADAVQLRRFVQTFQWEERTSRGSSVSYAQIWSDKIIDSTRFNQPGGPQNPAPRFRPDIVTAPEAWLGPYRIAAPLLRTLSHAQPMPVADGPAFAAPGLHLTGGTLYVGPEPGTPHIGDQRVTWEAVRLPEASVVAQQQGAGFVAYPTRSGSSVALISPGIMTAGQMLGEAVQANGAAAWVFRVIGLGLLLAGAVLLRRARATA